MQAVSEPGSAPSPRHIPTPHDRLFKILFGDPERAADFLQMHLPDEIRRILSDKPPVLLDGNFVDETLSLRQSDLLYRVELRGGKEAFVYVLLEHMSKQDPRTPIRLATYILRVWDRHAEITPDGRLLLRPIIPLVIYNGPRRWNVPQSLIDLVDLDGGPLRELLRGFSYLVADLGHMSDRSLARGQELRAGILAMIHAYRRPPAARILVRILRLLPDGSSLEAAVVEFIVSVYSIKREELESAAREAKPKRWEAMMDTIAEQWLKEGEARGMELGMARGEARTRSAILVRLLKLRFGRLPAVVRKRIDGASQDQLDTWLDAVLDAPELEAVFTKAARD